MEIFTSIETMVTHKRTVVFKTGKKNTFFCWKKLISINKLLSVGYRVTHKGWDFRIDCTEFLLSVSNYIHNSPCNCKLVSFFVKWLNKPCCTFNFILEQSFFLSFRSSLQSHTVVYNDILYILDFIFILKLLKMKNVRDPLVGAILII